MRVDLTTSSDAQLVALIADKSQGHLAELYGRHAGWVLARLDTGAPMTASSPRRCRTRSSRCGAARRYDGHGAVRRWLWGIAIRRLIGLLRKRPPAAVAVDDATRRW